MENENSHKIRGKIRSEIRGRFRATLARALFFGSGFGETLPPHLSQSATAIVS